MGKDFHLHPFDESTLNKLRLYEKYLTAWLPTFIADSRKLYTNINIFDFFCGPGFDSERKKGSPIIALDVISKFHKFLVKNRVMVNCYFSDTNLQKIHLLTENISNYKQHIIKSQYVKVNIESANYRFVFDQYFPIIIKPKTANLLFIDQSGVQQVDKKLFLKIINIPVTDVLFFISSSFLRRFPSLRSKIGIDDTIVKNCEYFQLHRNVKAYYQSLVPQNKQYYIGAFSIKKLRNIYGLIFGSGHIRGIDKFVKACWSEDSISGDANYDIYNDNMITGDQLSFLDQFYRPKKLEIFQRELADKILDGELNTNKEVYVYTLTNEFMPSHAREVIKHLIKSKKLPSQKINISYDAFKNPNTIVFHQSA